MRPNIKRQVPFPGTKKHFTIIKNNWWQIWHCPHPLCDDTLAAPIPPGLTRHPDPPRWAWHDVQVAADRRCPFHRELINGDFDAVVTSTREGRLTLLVSEPAARLS
jgi:hypothetical protein